MTNILQCQLNDATVVALAEGSDEGIVIMTRYRNIVHRNIQRVDELVARVYELYEKLLKVNFGVLNMDHDCLRYTNGRVYYGRAGEPGALLVGSTLIATPHKEFERVLLILQTLNAVIKGDVSWDKAKQNLEELALPYETTPYTVLATKRLAYSGKVRHSWLFTFLEKRQAWVKGPVESVLKNTGYNFIAKRGNECVAFATTNTDNNQRRHDCVVRALLELDESSSKIIKVVYQTEFSLQTVGMHGKVGDPQMPKSAVISFVGAARVERIVLGLDGELDMFIEQYQNAMRYGIENPVDEAIVRRVRTFKEQIFCGNYAKLGG